MLAILQAKAGITEDIIARMTEHSTDLSKGRKRRAMPATLATPEDISGFTLLGCHPLHKTSKVPASTALACAGGCVLMCSAAGLPLAA